MFSWPYKLFFSISFVIAISLAAGLIMAWSGAYLYIAPTLPDTKTLSRIKIQAPLHIYSLDGNLIGKYGPKHRKTVIYDDTPELLVKAILAAEDDRFFLHNGVDFKSLGRAIYSYVDDEQKLSGGSTITMQLAKMYFLTYDKTILRKLNQVFLAWHIEMHHNKKEILELYLNKVFLGNHAYGVQSAAEAYYNKSLNDLTLAQIAMIAGLPKAPSANNPLSNPQNAMTRRNWILKRMYHLGYIDYLDYINASKDLNTAQHYVIEQNKINSAFAYPAEIARKQAYKMYGEDIYTGGYTIYTTIDTRLQQAANNAVIQGLNAYAQRHGYRGAEAHFNEASIWQSELEKRHPINGLQPAIVSAVESRAITARLTDQTSITIPWSNGLQQARPFIDSNHLGPNPELARHIVKIGDLIRVKNTTQGWHLSQIPKAQAALIAIAPQDGKILAMMGGYNFDWSKFNRATQAKRQPGSTLKPLLYAAAMELKDFNAASVINDTSVEYETAQGTWKPENASGKHYGSTRLRQALYDSRNVVSIQLLEKLGIRNFINYLGRFGLDTQKLPFNLSLALGTNSITPLQVANLFADIANGGYHITPHLISRIDKYEQPIYYADTPVSCFNCDNYFSKQQQFSQRKLSTALTHETLLQEISKPSLQQAPRAMDSRVNYILDSMLHDVITKGTGQKAQALNRDDIRGKTGTTNGPLDAWFAGYQPDIAVTAWLGFDQNEALGKQEFGGSAALPIWISFMHQALKNMPLKYLTQPSEITLLPINPHTGKILAKPTDNSIMEMFLSEQAAAATSDKNTFSDGTSSDDNLSGSDINFDPSTHATGVPIYDTQLGTYITPIEAGQTPSNTKQTHDGEISTNSSQHTTTNNNNSTREIYNEEALQKELNHKNTQSQPIETTPEPTKSHSDIDTLIEEEARESPTAENTD